MIGKRKLERYCGDLSQVFCLQPCVLESGRAGGTHAVLVDNGADLELLVLLDKCMGIPRLKYRGINIGFICKNGISAPQFYQEDGTRGFLRNFEAGFLTTCGLTYFGTPCEVQGQKYGLHGVIANTPMENICTRTEWLHDQAFLKISGDAREGYLFGPNLVLHKELCVPVGSNKIEIHDSIENKGFEESSLMILYHFNYGYPFLCKDMEILCNFDKITARDMKSEVGIANIDQFDKPLDGFDEVVAYRTMSTQKKTQKKAYTLVYNPDLKIGVQMTFDPLQLPVLNQWKSPRAGDYVLGMEPGTGHVGGYEATRRAGLMQYIKPGETKKFDITIEFFEEKELTKRKKDMEES